MEIDKRMVGRSCVIKDSGSVKAWTIAGFHPSGDVILQYDGRVNTSQKFSLDRLEILPIADLRKVADYGVRMDSYRIEHDEATELLAHFLMLSHMYFQCAPEDARNEVFRLIALREGDDPNGVVMTGAMAAYDAWHARYEELKGDD